MGLLTNALLRRAHKVAVKQSAISSELTAAFEERYGATYSDVDEDMIIDALDYGVGGPVTLAECDNLMTAAGYPPRC